MEATLYCRCAHLGEGSRPRRERALEALCASGRPFLAVADLCELAARAHPALAGVALVAARHPLTLLACEPRAVRALFRASGAPLPDALPVTLVNLRGTPPNGPAPSLSPAALDSPAGSESPIERTAPCHVVIRTHSAPRAALVPRLAAVIGALLDRGFNVLHAPAGSTPLPALRADEIRLALSLGPQDDAATVEGAGSSVDLLPQPVVALAEAAPGADRVNRPGWWKPWFPVIDYSLCTNCQACLNFCLFGVYGVDPDAQVKVVAPDHCKTDCPACARVCPKGAILFPKHPHPPINGGAEPDPDDLPGFSDPFSGDLHDMLRRRSASQARPFSPERTPEIAAADRALRLRALLAQEGAGAAPGGSPDADERPEQP